MSTNTRIESLKSEGDQVAFRVEKLSKIRARGENPYPNGMQAKNLSRELHQKYGEMTREQLDPLTDEVIVAGRAMAIRSFGKAAFVRLRDRAGEIQLFVELKTLGPEVFERLSEWDLGDIVWARGKMFRTQKGELSVHCQEIKLVTKSLRPLPEKFHGISDIEIKYRNRYLDLMTSPESREVFVKRSKIIEEVRSFFLERDFLEVETPMMHAIAGGAAARPFKTHHNTLDMDLFLRIAPELYLKRLVVGGFDRVFEINRNFRNEGISIKHNPEFTMIEFYQAYATFEDLMPLTEELFRRVARAVHGREQISYQGTEIDLGKPWARLSLEDAVLMHSQFKDRAKIRDRDSLLAYGKSHQVPMDPKLGAGGLLLCIFDAEVESKLIQPTFITHYPFEVSPLARKNDADPYVTDRFELFVYGREMANAFSELNDPVDQYERFLGQVAAKAKGDEEACDMDEDYIRALEFGMPPAAGQGIGIDRLVMLMTDSASIRDVILFPQMRPQVAAPADPVADA